MLQAEKLNYLSTKFNVQHGQEDLYMSNRNFTVLRKLLNEKKIKANHIPFTFSYLYLQTYMFRYAKYDYFVPTTKEIKEILGYSPTNKDVDKIIKDGGLLDAEEITQTIYDFPVIQEWDSYLQQPEFTMLSALNEGGNGYGSQWRKERGIKTNQSCKYPIYAFYGQGNDFLDETTLDEGGSFFNMTNTTNIDINVFMYCMSNDDLESTGFYLYSFLKWKCDCTDGEIFGIGYERIATETGLSERTVKKYIKLLRQYNLINCLSGTFIIYEKGEEKNPNDLEPNRYAVNPFKWFYEDKQNELTKPVYVANSTIKSNQSELDDKSKEIEDELSRLFG